MTCAFARRPLKNTLQRSFLIALDFEHRCFHLHDYLSMIYEYKCHGCGQLNEFWMKMSDPAPGECPSCKGSELEKVISKTSFALKGSGWYTSDYKKASSAGGASTIKSEAETPSTGGSCCSGSSCAHKAKD